MRFEPKQQRYFFQVSVQLKDTTGKQLWSGEVYGEWMAMEKLGSVHFEKPGRLKLPLQPGWVELP